CHVPRNYWDTRRVRYAFRPQGELDLPSCRTPESTRQYCCSAPCTVSDCCGARLVSDGCSMPHALAFAGKRRTSGSISIVRNHIDRCLPVTVSKDPFHLFLASRKVAN